MNSDPLLSCRIKIDRANKHLNDFKYAMKPFLNAETYRIYPDVESEPGVKIYRIRIIEDIPAEFSGFIGDVIHNLRGALDCLAYQLILRADPNTGEDILRKIYFPISWNATDLFINQKREIFFKRVGPDVEKLFRRLQPYRGGKGHILWQLDNLDIADKHRRIIPARAGVANITFYVLPNPDGSPVDLPKYQPPFPLKDGDEICRAIFFEPHFNSNAHFGLAIAFNEPPFIVGEAVVETLAKFIDFVERLIDIFRRNIFR